VSWIGLAIVLVAAFVAAFGASFLSAGWKRLHKIDPSTQRVEAMLPGYDCRLCNHADCRSFASAIAREGADPAACLPGGSRLETRLLSFLAERHEESRIWPLRAVVRCGGGADAAAAQYEYDGRRDCSAAILRYGGPKRCKEGCVGLGSCVPSCPLGAIRLVPGLAIVDPARCTGCGACLSVCPTNVISLLPRAQAWYVACASKREPSYKAEVCRAACTACGDCAEESGRSEFQLEGALAKENSEAIGGRWADIAENCPTGAITRAGAEKT